MSENTPASINIGYIPYSTDLQHPADRRRLAAWAVSTRNILNIKNPLESDILILSNAANFGHWLSKAHQPVILDLVDGYIGEQPNFLKDFVRNSLRTLQGTSNFKWITYTRHLKTACRRSDGIIVASPEQRENILQYNSNVYVILDDHSELSNGTGRKVAAPTKLSIMKEKYMFWEGFGYTLKHFQLIAKDLDAFLVKGGWRLFIVTVRVFPKWGGFLGVIDSETLIKKWFPNSWERITLVPWTINNVKRYSAMSKIAIIPIDKKDKFGSLKSENKLLSMWQLGLPVLFSNIPSYRRVANESNQVSFCIDDEDWEVAFDSLSNSTFPLDYMSDQRESYLKQFHTHKILMEKWETAIFESASKREHRRGTSLKRSPEGKLE